MKIKIVIDVSCLGPVLDLDLSRLELDISATGFGTRILFDKLRGLRARKTGQGTYETSLDKCDIADLISIIRLFRPRGILYVNGRVAPLEPDEVLELVQEYVRYRERVWAFGRFRGNYVELLFQSEDRYEEAIRLMRRELCFEVYTFDREAGTTVLKERCLFYPDEANRRVTIYRGNLPRLLKHFPISIGKYVDLSEDIPQEVVEKLRDYQVEVLQSILRQLRTCGAVTVHITTGGGKTFLVGAIARVLEGQGIPHPYFYIVPSVTLVHQARDFLIEYWNYREMEVVTVGGGSRPGINELTRAKIICTTVQSLYRAICTVLPDVARKFRAVGEEQELEEEERAMVLDREYASTLIDLYRKSRVVILDEGHHCPCMMIKCVLHVNPTALRIAMTATPWRADGRDLEIYAYAGEIAERRVTASELIAKGVLAPLIILQYIRRVSLPEDVWRKIRAFRAARQGARAYMLVRKHVLTLPERVREIVEIAQAAPKPVIIFMRERSIAEDIYAQLDKTRLRTALFTGQVSGPERERILRMARAGRLDIIVATTVAEEGIDIPVLKTGIFADAPKSKIRVVQRAGRLVRKAPGKEYALLIDIVDDAPYLREHGKEREKIYKQEPEWQIYTINNLQTLLKILKEIQEEEQVST